MIDSGSALLATAATLILVGVLMLGAAFRLPPDSSTASAPGPPGALEPGRGPRR